MATLKDSIVSYTRAEIVGSLVLALVVACLVVGTIRRTGWAAVRGSAATLAAAAAFAVLIYIAAPDQVGQFADINARLGLYAVLFLLLWLAAQPIRRRAQWPSCVAALVIALGLTLARLPTQVRYDRYVAEFEQARRVVRPNSTLLTLRVRFDRPRVRRSPDLLLRETGRLAAETRGVDRNHYEVMLAYFPTRFRPQYNSSAASARPITTCGPHRPGPSCSRTTGRPAPRPSTSCCGEPAKPDHRSVRTPASSPRCESSPPATG